MNGFETGNASEIMLVAPSAGFTVQSAVKRTGGYAGQANLAGVESHASLAAVGATGTQVSMGRTAATYYTFYFRIGTLPSVDSRIASVVDTTGARVIGLNINNTGALTILGSTTVAVATLSTGTWYRIEMMAVTNGTSAVRIDGGTPVEVTGMNITQAYFYLGPNGATVTYNMYYDDVAINDSDYTGAGQVNILKPNGAGIDNIWANGAGTSPTNVAEVPYDSDTSYITSTAAGGHSLALDNSATGGVVGTIPLVKFVVIARSTVSGDLSVGLRTSGGWQMGSAISLTTSYAPYFNLKPLDLSSSDWTTSALDASEVRFVNSTGNARVTAAYAMVWSTPNTAITFRSSSNSTTGIGTEPVGAAQGDLLIAVARSVTTGAIGPAGWTKIDVDHGTGGVMNVWYIIRGASAPSYVWTVNLAGGLAISDYDTQGMGAVINTFASTDTSAVSPSVTTTVANSRLISLIMTTSCCAITVPPGMILRVAGGSGGGVYQADVEVPTASTTGTKTWGTSGYGVYSVAIALPPPNTAPTFIAGPNAISYAGYTRTGPNNPNWTMYFAAADAEQSGAGQLTWYIHTQANQAGTLVSGPSTTTGNGTNYGFNFPYNSTGMFEGTNNMYLRLYDGSLYSAANPMFTIYRDDTAPTAATSISTTPGTVITSNYTVTFTPNDAVSTNANEISYKICTANDTCASPITGGTGTSQSGVAKTTGTLTDSSLTNGANSRWIRTCDGANNCTNTGFTVTYSSTPTLTSPPTSASITGSSALLGGNITAQGGSAVTARGVCYSVTATNANPQSGGSGATCVAEGGSGIGTFTETVNSLTPNTNTYSFTAYATNTQGTGYSSAATFITPNVNPTGVDTNSPTGVNSYYVTLSGVANPNAYATTGHFRVYSANPGNCNSDSAGIRYPQSVGNDVVIGADTSPHTYTYTIPVNATTFLQPNTTYWYCSFAINTNGTVGGATVASFITPDGPASPCDPPAGGNLTIPATATCNLNGNFNGVDTGTGTTNNAALTLSTNAQMTIGPSQKVSFGSFVLQKPNSSLVIARGGSLIKGGIFVHDEDNDNYLDDAVQYIGTAPPAGYKRRNLISSIFNYAWKIASGGATFDCNNTTPYAYRTLPNLVRDADNDGYKTSTAASWQCVGAAASFNGRTYYQQ